MDCYSLSGRTGNDTGALQLLKFTFRSSRAPSKGLALVWKLTAQLPEVDMLVNNLGIFEPKAIVQIPHQGWLRFFNVNVLSG